MFRFDLLQYAEALDASLARLSHEGFRRRPVPGTSGSRPSRHVDYLRYPKTQSARRAAYSLQEEGEPLFRGKRRANHIPTCWDDAPRTIQRSWKVQRATRWKPTRS